MKEEREHAKERFELEFKAVGYLLTAHGAGLAGCLTLLKDYQSTPQLKGMGLFIGCFSTGLLLAPKPVCSPGLAPKGLPAMSSGPSDPSIRLQFELCRRRSPALSSRCFAGALGRTLPRRPLFGRGPPRQIRLDVQVRQKCLRPTFRHSAAYMAKRGLVRNTRRPFRK
jgi:hypothetical protein